jgi:large subunit ribosomal protein L29
MSQRTKTLKKLRDMEPDALTREEAELRTAIWKMKVQQGTGQVTDSLKLEGTKRDLARLMTVRREREVAKTAAERS